MCFLQVLPDIFQGNYLNLSRPTPLEPAGLKA